MKKILTYALVLVIVSLSLVSIEAGKTCSASSMLPYFTGLSVTSPLNRTYTSSFLTLKVGSSGLGASNIHLSANYSLDGIYNGTIPIDTQGHANSFQVAYSASVSLPELTLGSHWVTVYSELSITDSYANGVLLPVDSRLSNTTVYFTISDVIPPAEGVPPTVSNLSLENKTYSTPDLSELSFTLDKPVTWMGYCLDNEINGTIGGYYDLANGNQINATVSALRNLAEGSHSLVIYANSTADVTGASQTIYFTVAAQPAQETTPAPTETASSSPNTPLENDENDYGQFPLWAVAALALCIALALTVTLLCHKKTRKNP